MEDRFDVEQMARALRNEGEELQERAEAFAVSVTAVQLELDELLPMLTPAVQLVAEERNRQRTEEQYALSHDDTLTDGQLADMASCYAAVRRGRFDADEPESAPARWPWDGEEGWKPCPDDRVRELVKAGALILAEIERVQRARLRLATAAGDEQTGESADA